MLKAILNILIDKFMDRKGVGQIQEMPAIQIGRTAIETYWTRNQDVIKDFSEAFVKGQAEQMMDEVTKIATSSDPRMANREKLTSCVTEFAQFQVLVLDPPPAEDPTGLRVQHGVTGELKAHLAELVQKDKSLREFMYGFPTPKNQDDVWNCVLGRYRQVFAWTSVYQMMRLAFDDVNHVEGKDWFRPFVAAMCAWQEHQYRGLLGMPSALGGDSDKEAVKYSLFAEFVLEGARFPDLAWHDQAEDVYEAMLDESKSRILNSVSENRLKD